MSEQSPLLTSTLALLSALVAALSVYFTYKGRHNLLRQVVYGRQMDAYFDITGAMTALYTAAQNAVAFSNPRFKAEDRRERFRAAVREEHDHFTGTVNRALIVLPSKVKAAVDHFNEILVSLGPPPEERPAGGDAPPDAAPEPGQVLAEAYGRAINSIRHHLAIDSLTTGMLREMGIGSESVTLQSARVGVNPLVPVGRGTP